MILEENNRLGLLSKLMKVSLTHFKKFAKSKEKVVTKTLLDNSLRTTKQMTSKMSVTAIYNINDVLKKEDNEEYKVINILNSHFEKLKYKPLLESRNLVFPRESGDSCYIIAIQDRNGKIKHKSGHIAKEGIQAITNEEKNALISIIRHQTVIYSPKNQEKIVNILKSIVR